MVLSIKDAEVDRLARELAKKTGKSLTEAVADALREQMAREERKRRPSDALVNEVMAISRHYCSLPLKDTRSAEDIIGYDADGLVR